MFVSKPIEQCQNYTIRVQRLVM